jgi:hypothetical protein
MATRTKTQLALAALQHIGVVDADGNMAAADADYVIARYEDLWEEMTDDNNLAYWERDEIPSVVFEPLIHLMGVSVAPAFGKPSTVKQIEENLMICKRRIRRHSKVTSADVQSPSEDF